jgi:PPM family protein phosphatase
MSADTCPGCSASIVEDDRYCESCGRRLAPLVQWLSSAALAGPCAACGGSDFTPEGYCEQCGRRRILGQDRAELDLGGLGGATDRGRHKHRNEDAIAIARLGPSAIAVVCDGVSSSSRADAAAQAAVDTGLAALLEALEGGASAAAATEAGARSAATAVAQLGGPEVVHNPPSCTYVSAIVTPTDVTVGWVGDSRVYWLAPDGGASVCLTTDDSLAGQLAAGQLAAGSATQPPAAPADADPRGLALVRWLGADAIDTEPKVIVFTPPTPGQVLVCSDGLYRYLPEPDALAAAAALGPPASTAVMLTQLALDAGGQDNIAVAVLPFPPLPAPPESGANV